MATKKTTAKKPKTTKKTQTKAKSVKKVTTKLPAEKKQVNEPKLQLNPSLAKKLPMIAGGILVFLLVFGLLFYLRKVFVAATVNGQYVTRLEVVKELEKQGGQQALDSLISRKLLLQHARQEKVEVTSADIDKQIEEIEKTVKDQGKDLDSLLTLQGLTREELRDQIEVQLLLEKLLSSKVTVSDKEVANYIETNKENLPEELGEKQLKTEVRTQLENQKLTTEAQNLIQELKQKAEIKYFIEY
jgi:foldase protein PrsA